MSKGSGVYAVVDAFLVGAVLATIVAMVLAFRGISKQTTQIDRRSPGQLTAND